MDAHPHGETPSARFRHGLRYPLRGARYLLDHPELWPWVALPALINVGLLLGATAISFVVVPFVISTWLTPPEGLLYSVWIALVVMLSLAVFGFSAVVLYTASGLVALPFQELLSSRMEDQLLGELVEEATPARVLGDVAMSLRHTLAALAMWVMVMGPLLLLNLFPPIGELLYLGLGGTATAFFLAREMVDSPLSRRRLAFREKLRWLRSDLSSFMGLGAATGLLLWIPLLNFVCLPISVAGGTLMFAELVAAGRYPQDPRRGPGGELL
jgi:CysZ protein